MRPRSRARSSRSPAGAGGWPIEGYPPRPRRDHAYRGFDHTENVRILQLLFIWRQGAITALEFVERVRGAVPDPLAEQKSD
jgi:hypothetical protein